MATSSVRPAEHAENASLAEGVYQSLRTAILHGTYRPNQRLVETDIAEELGASRTPVREALHRLGAQGLILKSRHGWVVREFTIDEIREIYEVRAALEGYAARLAAERATDDHLHALAELIDEQRKLVANSPIHRPAVVDINDRFHDVVIEAAGNVRLDGLLKANRMYYFNYRLASVYTQEQTIKSLKDHEDLVEAIKGRDVDRSERLSREHVGVALSLIAERLA